MKKQRRHLNVVLRPEPEGGFTAVVPALPGYVTCGRTLARARTMAKDTMTGYIESLKKRNEPVPGDEETLVRRWILSMPKLAAISREQLSPFLSKTELLSIPYQ